MILPARGQGRLPGRDPVAIVDIGSNSVRLVIYEGSARTPTLLFNEKILAGLGSNLASTGMLSPAGVEQALSGFHRFRALAEQAGVGQMHILATAAARQATNGPDFINRAKAILGRPIHVLTGAEEARFAALGVVAHIRNAQGVVGDLGGGSLELTCVTGTDLGNGITLPLGGLYLAETTNGDPLKARKIARDALKQTDVLTQCSAKEFYAVGGTWRNLAKLHMAERSYPLSIMHEYTMDPQSSVPFLTAVVEGRTSTMDGITDVSKNRRSLLPFGAALLLEIIDRMQPARIVMSGTGVREGYLYDQLPNAVAEEDALIEAARELAFLQARSFAHSEELVAFAGKALHALGLTETENEARLRKAACLIADTGWRAHPDYRGDQALNTIAYNSFTALNHGERAFISMVNYYRHEGLTEDGLAHSLLGLMDEAQIQRSRVLGLLMRVLYVFSAAMPGVLPLLSLDRKVDGSIVLTVPPKLAALVGDRPAGRLAKFGKLLDAQTEIVIAAG